jgi:hypothetical protein
MPSLTFLSAENPAGQDIARVGVAGLYARLLVALILGLLANGAVRAHNVLCWNPATYSYDTNTIRILYPTEDTGWVCVTPELTYYLGYGYYYEPCTVGVNVTNSSSLLNATVLTPNPANTVWINIKVLRPPVGSYELATVSGEWHATGLPAGYSCDATNPHPFTVSVGVWHSNLVWQVWQATPGSTRNELTLDAGENCTLQFANSVTGPYFNVGQGQRFTICTDMGAAFFQRSTPRLGGYAAGYVRDGSGNPLANIKLGLLYGGPTARSDAYGAYAFPPLTWGTNLFTLTNPLGASLNVLAPILSNLVASFTVSMTVGAAVSNATPWCAVGYAALDGVQSPLYYAGGVSRSGTWTGSHTWPQVWVNPPGGNAFSIRPGSSWYQNSGPNHKPGLWTVTTIWSGLSNSASLMVP